MHGLPNRLKPNKILPYCCCWVKFLLQAVVRCVVVMLDLNKYLHAFVGRMQLLHIVGNSHERSKFLFVDVEVMDIIFVNMHLDNFYQIYE